MTKTLNAILSLLLPCTMLLSCAESDDIQQGTAQGYDLAFSVKRQEVTRMAGDVVQADNSFRGLHKLVVIPFVTEAAAAVTVDDFPLLSITGGSEANRVTGKDYYYIGHCSLSKGTNRVLVYGQASTISGKDTPVQNGLLVTDVGTTIVPADLSFNLQSIRTTTDVHADAQALANYLTAIANTTGWSTTDDAALKALYLDFIHAESDGTGLMAGSAAHVRAYVRALREQLEGNGDALSTAIIANIDNATLSACLDNGYPSAATSLGLPDGAAAIRWIASEHAFSVRTQTTTLDNINGITRYVYPAELWYYVNSAIFTSNKEVGETTYETEDWATILAKYDERAVTVNTKSAAVESPLQYAVAHLQMTLKTITGTLRDAKDVVVDYGTAANLPLTAVIVGGQHNVGFDFKPVGVQSDVDARFIYDPVVGTATSDGWTVNTLVLQTYDNEKVPVILELENKTGYKFTGKDGVIYPNTKFYLIGELNPAGLGTGAYAGRVFTQDYTTAVTMTVTSLANAYSCMPDLLSPRLEIGVQVQTQWEQSTPTTVKL